jgi:hypothetical protein
MIDIAAVICVVICAYLLYMQIRLERRRRKWADLAIAYSVCYECALDYYKDVPGEGCGTRSKRRDRIERQWVNGREALEVAMAELGVEWDA